MFLKYNSSLREISRNLRANQTKAEKIAWQFLKQKYPDLKFNRQVPIDNFVVDFFCKKINLIIEIDDEIHELQKEKDKERDNYLFVKYNLKTMRISNDEITNKQSLIVQKIDSYLTSFEGGRHEERVREDVKTQD